MKTWKALFVGAGSIAKRHIRNISAVAAQRGEKIQIDVYRSGRGSALLDEEIQQLAACVYYDFDEVPYGYDMIFITNPTHLHIETIHRFSEKGRHFFIEKPFCTPEQAEDFQMELRADSIYYVAAPLRYHAVIQYIKENVSVQSVLSIRSISSSYLPEWRRGTDYRKTYSAHQALGGGVSIDLIHEWDYITDIFGFPQKVAYMHGKKSMLEIDSDDYAVYIAEYENMTAEVHLDYFGRSAIREIMLVTKEDTIIGDLIKGEVIYLKQGRKIDFCETRDRYQSQELHAFFDMISGRAENHNDVLHTLKVLRLTQGEL